MKPLIGLTYSTSELEKFTLWSLMFQGVVAAGGVPIAIDARNKVPEIDRLVPRLDGLILAGGGDISPILYRGDPSDPLLRGVNLHRDSNEVNAWLSAKKAEIPVLAICRGAQLMNVLHGGELYIDLERDRGKVDGIRHRGTPEELEDTSHQVTITSGSRVATWLGQTEVNVNSQHHQGIKRLGNGLKPVAFAPDELIEAYEHEQFPLTGVQWHPEVLWRTEPIQLQILKGFIDSTKPDS